MDINAKGQIVGYASTYSDEAPTFLYQQGRMTDLGTLGGQESTALAINEAGQILGTSGSRGFLYSQGKMIDLNAFLPQGSGWKSLTPRCINDRGQIVGTGIATDGKPHIFLTTPAP